MSSIKEERIDLFTESSKNYIQLRQQLIEFARTQAKQIAFVEFKKISPKTQNRYIGLQLKEVITLDGATIFPSIGALELHYKFMYTYLSSIENSIFPYTNTKEL
ncbi:hypothetical protein ACNO6G_23760 [Vibrio harveyi]|uniref:hypothetical protein n=1 Tax=Vibrio harveyi TaxID=669 RepID=UPI003AADFEAF